MNIDSPYAFLLLLLVPAFIWLAYRHNKLYRQRFSKYAESAFYPIFLRQRSPFYSILKLSLLIVAFALLILSLARPQWDYRERELDSQGMDIIFALDVSRSMEANDIQPNRLLRSILQVSAFVDQLKGDRLGVISFAGAATIECPLTDDHEAVKMVLSSLNTDNAARAGTDIGRALDLASQAFNAGSGSGVLVLISDGEDLAENAMGKARDLASRGVRIYTMGVGSEQGAKIVNPYTGEEHISQLDTKNLQEIAKIGGGEFYHVTPSAAEIQLMLSRIYQTEQKRSATRSLSLYKEQYHLFAIMAILFLLLESSILPLAKENRKTS